MRYDPLAQGASIVIVGNFNPAILSPDGLVRNGLIDDFELGDAKVSIIHPEIAEFQVGGFTLQVQKQRFQASVIDEPFVKLADLITRLFSEVLPHTPMTQIGIGYNLHFALDKVDQRRRLGRALAPLGPWGQWGNSLENADPIRAGGMRSLLMEETRLDDREKGYRRVQIEPSIRSDIVDPYVGVYMAITDHFEVARPEQGQTAEVLISWMAANFDSSIQTAKNIVADLMEFAGNI